MKKMIIILSVLVAISLAGILYGTQGKSDKEETVTAEQVYMDQYPDPMPNIILYPIPGISL